MKIPQELIDQFSRKNGAIFVGAGLSIGAGLPGWGQLMDRLSVELPDSPKQTSYLDLAQYYVNEHKKNRLISRLRDELDTSSIEPTSVHDAIAQIKVSPIFTTNFDNLIEKSFLNASVKFDKVISEIDSSFWTNERTQLVKLHGDLDHPSSIVITSEDYERYLNTHSAFVRILTYALQTKTTLFLGYSANDIDIRSLLTLIQQESGEYARNAFSVMFDAHQSVIKDLERRGIRVVNFEDIPDKDKNKVLSEWLIEFKEEVEKNSSGSGKQLKKYKNLPSEPYKFLNWFGTEDIAIFHGRDYEIESLTSLISSQKVVVLYGESGTGKTSLLRAGVLPKLRENDYLISYLRPLTDPYKELNESLKNCLGKVEGDVISTLEFVQENLPNEKMLVVVIDQFEEFFIRQGPKVRNKFIQTLFELVKDTNVNIRLVFSLRSDYLDKLDELEEAMGRDPLRFRMRLHNLGPANASAAISEPARDFKIPLETTLLERLVSDLEQGGIAPAQLQIVCFVLWQDWIQRSRPSIGLTYERYLALGSTQDILTQYLKNVIRDLEMESLREELGITLDSEKAQEAAKAILKSMITSERTKVAVNGKEITQSEIVAKLKTPPSQADAVLLYLQNRRVIRHLFDTEYYELVHEVMIQQIWEWVTDEEKNLLDVQDLLVRATTDYKKFQALLSADYLNLITEQARNLNLNDDALELLLRSAIAHNFSPKTWAEKMKPNQAVDILAQLLTSENKTLYPQIAQTLGATKSAKSVRYLDDLLKEENRDIQRSAAEAMAMLKLSGVIPSLFHAAMRENSLYRCAPILDALEEIHSDESTAMLMLVASEHKESGVRTRATNAVVRLGSRKGIYLLIQQLNSDDLSVTESASHAIETILKTKMGEVLELFRNSEMSFRLKIIKGLDKVHGEEKLEIIKAALLNDELDIKKSAVNSLLKIDNADAVNLLYAILNDDDIEIRVQAVVALGKVNDVRAVEPLIDLLKNADVEVRTQALGALEYIQDVRLVGPLIDLLHDENTEIRMRAIVALGQLKDIRVVQPLIDLLNDENADIRMQVIVTLGNLKDVRAIEPLIDMLNDKDVGIRVRAMTALRQSDVRAIEMLSNRLNSEEDIRMKQQLAISLRQLQDVYASELLIAEFKDANDNEIRLKVLSEIGKIGYVHAVEPLIAQLKDGDVEIRRRVANTLGTLKERRGVEPLILALKDVDVDVRRYAISALGQLKDNRAIQPLISAFRENDTQIKCKIISALVKFKTHRAITFVQDAVMDEDETVRKAALRALH